MSDRVMAFLTLAMLLTAPVLAQDEPISEPELEPFPVHAAAWCAFQDRENSTPAAAPETADQESQETTEEPPEPGCDGGVGAKLFTFQRAPRLSIVAALGAETLGGGLALRIGQVAGNPVAIAVGAVVRYDLSTGIDASEVYPVLGATLSFSRISRD